MLASIADDVRNEHTFYCTQSNFIQQLQPHQKNKNALVLGDERAVRGATPVKLLSIKNPAAMRQDQEASLTRFGY
jgi:hypothetical protein